MDSNEKNLDMMTQEDIERLLAEQQNNIEKPNFEDADLASLLSELEAADDADIQEISDLLNKAEKNEAVDDDVLTLMKKQESEGENAYDAMDLFSNAEPEKKENFIQKLVNHFKQKRQENQLRKQEKKQEKLVKKQEKEEKKRQKQEEKQKQKEQREKSKVDEPEVEETDAVMDAALSMLRGNTAEISADASKGDSKKEKKQKPAKKKKEKKTGKAKGEAAVAGEDEVEEQLAEKSSKKKPKKEKKVKDKKKKGNDEQDELASIREKGSVQVAASLLEDDDSDEMPNKKKIIVVFVAAVMIMFGFLVVNFYFTGHANKQLAEEAYEEKDYLECYQLMYGQRLNDSQAVMFHRSELILKMDIFRNHYNEFVAEKKILESLDELVQFVSDYPELSVYAAEWNCLDIVESTYQNVVRILTDDYEVTEQEVLQIAALESDVDYTRALVELVEVKQNKDSLELIYPDMLPEEQDRVTQNE